MTVFCCFDALLLFSFWFSCLRVAVLPHFIVLDFVVGMLLWLIMHRDLGFQRPFDGPRRCSLLRSSFPQASRFCLVRNTSFLVRFCPRSRRCRRIRFSATPRWRGLLAAQVRAASRGLSWCVALYACAAMDGVQEP